MLVLPVRIELTTSALPRMRSTTELRQHARGRAALRDEGGRIVKALGAAKGNPMSDQDKAERLAAALRANLRRRKEQARAAPVTSAPPTDPDPDQRQSK